MNTYQLVDSQDEYILLRDQKKSSFFYKLTEDGLLESISNKKKGTRLESEGRWIVKPKILSYQEINLNLGSFLKSLPKSINKDLN